MPFTNVMPQFGKGKLHSGSKTGPVVKKPKQAVAIMLNEKKKAAAGNQDYSNQPVVNGGQPLFPPKKKKALSPMSGLPGASLQGLKSAGGNQNPFGQ